MRTLSREQSRTVDRIAIEEYGMSGLVLMENAGRGVTDRLCELGIDGPVVICCGRGNNAGDGFVIARHLDLRGHLPWVLLWADPGELTGDAAENFRILRKTRVPILPSCEARDQTWLAEQLARANWIVDALLGTGARGNPRPPVDQVIAAINASGRRVLAVDLPSGLDCDTGEPGEPRSARRSHVPSRRRRPASWCRRPRSTSADCSSRISACRRRLFRRRRKWLVASE